MNIDWNLLRAFVAVAEAGSLSAAARALGISQPTVGRHIDGLEEALGVSLFKRHSRGLELTERGVELFAVAQQIGEGVDRFARVATGLAEEVTGTVRISASEVVAQYVIPHMLAALRTSAPCVQLEVVADNRSANLLRRDADIAIRMFRPTQQELVGKQVAQAALGLFASPGYVQRCGMPGGLADTEGHTLIGLDRDTMHLAMLKRHGFDLRREDFDVRSDAQAFVVAAVEAGVGISAVQEVIARRMGLVHVLPEVALPTMPVWLVAHAELRRSARVRLVFDALAEGLSSVYAPVM